MIGMFNCPRQSLHAAADVSDLLFACHSAGDLHDVQVIDNDQSNSMPSSHHGESWRRSVEVVFVRRHQDREHGGEFRIAHVAATQFLSDLPVLHFKRA